MKIIKHLFSKQWIIWTILLSVMLAPLSVLAQTETITEANHTADAQTNDKAIIDFANKATIAAFTYDYKNYENNLQQASVYFTADGWVQFQEALAESKNLEAIDKLKLEVTAKLDGMSKILNQSNVDKQKVWEVEVPIAVNYQDPKNKILHKRYVTILDIVSIPKSESPTGLGIKQFIAKPAEK